VFRKWLVRIPLPLRREDREAGYDWNLSIWQMEVSLTQIFDRPLRGREFFEEIIRDNLDLGRPDRVQLVFDRVVTKKTPGQFRTRVIQNTAHPDTVPTVATSGSAQPARPQRGATPKENSAKRRKGALCPTHTGRGDTSGRAQNGTKAKATIAAQGQKARAQSKGAQILDLIGRPKGAPLPELMRVTAWQAHSVRGFLSTAAKKHNLKIASSATKRGSGSIAPNADPRCRLLNPSRRPVSLGGFLVWSDQSRSLRVNPLHSK